MGNTGGHVANEEKAADPAPVVAWRVDLEREIVKAAGLKIRTIIIRPALVYGHGGGL
ncbi:MAG: NAD-dependent epimerase, partial [Nitrospiraceae bacterium]